MAQRQVFINLPVSDLERSKAFFSALGYAFNPQFTDDKAACLVIDDGHIYAMLVTREFFKGFIPKTEIADATRVTEVLLALASESREEVDRLVETAKAHGGTEPRPAQDYGWMYGRAFTDPDGHIWEALYMDMTHVPANPGVSVDQNAA